MIDQISNVLKPGGLLDLSEVPFGFWDAQKRPFVVSPDRLQPPWVAVWVSYVDSAIRARGGEADAAHHLHQWVLEHTAFEDVVVRDIYIPASPWLEGRDAYTNFWNEVGATLRDDIKVANLAR